MGQFLLLLHDLPDDFADASPSEMQSIVQEYFDWRDSLDRDGKLVSSNKLQEDGGKNLTREGGSIRVTDGPYTEAKEVVGGYFLIEAADYDEAVAIARTCPHMTYGHRIEVLAVHLDYEA